MRVLILLAAAIFVSCTVSDKHDTEKYHDEMDAIHWYFLGVKDGRGPTGKENRKWRNAAGKNAPYVLHHYTAHHSFDTNFTKLIPIIEQAYSAYRSKYGQTNKAFDLSVIMSMAAEEGY